MRDRFFQFVMDEESLELYTFWTTKGLYKFNTHTQGVSSTSAETYDKDEEEDFDLFHFYETPHSILLPRVELIEIYEETEHVNDR